MDDRIRNNFKCTQCGACCRWNGYVLLTDKDIAAIAETLKISEIEFIKKHTRLAANRRQLALLDGEDGSCAFLEGSQCTIYTVRPEQCKTFPFEWIAGEDECPGLREVFRD